MRRDGQKGRSTSDACPIWLLEAWITLRAVLLDFAQGGPELNVKH